MKRQEAMPTSSLRIQEFEFENRIFVSFGIVIFICFLSFAVFGHVPAVAVILGRWAGLTERHALSLGYLIIAGQMALATLLRSWSGSVLTSERIMAFRIQADQLTVSGPYRFVRNPIYLADLVAFCGFVFCLPPVGLFLPVLLYLHYTQLIRYEELSLENQLGDHYLDYKNRVPRLLPDARSLGSLRAALKEWRLNADGLRHNALYLFFIPGFILAARTGRFLHAVLIGLPAVVDWAVVHTKIGTAKDFSRPLTEKTGSLPLRAEKKKVFQDILYANCWEDPEIDRLAFASFPNEVVFSITSGGCNVLTFLLDDPKKIIALDINRYQNYLLELKIAAFKELSYQEFLEFVGLKTSAERIRYYARLRPFLSEGGRSYWDGQTKKILAGIIHCGRYERYMRLLNRFIIRPFIKPSLIREFFATEDEAARERLFHEKWENAGWRLFTKILLSRTLNSLFFDKAFFAFLDEKFRFGDHFAKKAEQALVRLPLRENYFLSYILFRRFLPENCLPPYLKPGNYDRIRSRVDRIKIITDSCEHYFSTLPDSSIARFNFTNIFEWMSAEAYANLLQETIRVAKDGAILTYRNLLVRREHPPALERNIRSFRSLAKTLHALDLSFIYDNYVVEQVHKGGRP
jgi:S-adenosylmethionine-diacylglycerol 3-amino-3-carboxypropyl transferase